jgi:hypothetical protein
MLDSRYVELSYRILSAILPTTEYINVVPRAGLEPARLCSRQILSLMCLPISPPRQRAGFDLHSSGNYAPFVTGAGTPMIDQPMFWYRAIRSCA